MRWTIRQKLILYSCFPLLVTYIGLLAWDYNTQRANARKAMQEMVLTRARMTASVINARLEQAAAMADARASDVAALGSTVDLLQRPLFNAGRMLRAGERPASRPASRPGVEFRGMRLSDWVSTLVIAWDPNFTTQKRKTAIAFYASTGPRPHDISTQLDYLKPSSQWYLNTMRERRGVWYDPIVDPTFGPTPVAIYATPIVSGDEYHGVVAIAIPVGNFRRAAVSLPKFEAAAIPATDPPVTQAKPSAANVTATLFTGELHDFVVLNREGQFIYHPRNDLVMKNSGFDMTGTQDEGLNDGLRTALAGQGKVIAVNHLNRFIPGYQSNKTHWLAFVPIPIIKDADTPENGSSWVFETAIPESLVMDPILQEMGRRGGVLLLGMFLMVAIVYIGAVRFSRPIEAMAQAVKQVGEGDMQTRVPLLRGHDEVAQLSQAFNAMVGQIQVQLKEIGRESAAREKVESELRIASTIQANLLPRTFPPFPERREFELHGTNVPAAHVAGDFFDFFFVNPEKLVLVIADVAGKGVPAALLMAVTRTIIRNLAAEGLSPLQIIQRANAMLVDDSPSSMFVTIFLCEYEPTSGKIVYINAGHPTPIRLGDDGRCWRFGQSTAPLVGASKEWPVGAFTQTEDRLRHGDTLVLYTDGVTEARNSKGELFGEEALVEVITRTPAVTAQGMCERVIQAVDEYQKHNRADDLTILVLKRT